MDYVQIYTSLCSCSCVNLCESQSSILISTGNFQRLFSALSLDNFQPLEKDEGRGEVKGTATRYFSLFIIFTIKSVFF
jgi:hypothetical protein